MAVLLWLKLAFLLWNVLDLNLVLVPAYLFTLNHLAVVGDAYLKIKHFNIFQKIVQMCQRGRVGKISTKSLIIIILLNTRSKYGLGKSQQ